MKLSDFNIEDLKRMKQACIDTRAKYNGYRDHQIPAWNKGPCDLCIFNDSINGYTTCRYCPWVVIDEYRDNIDYNNPCRAARFDKQNAMTRRKRLDRWIKLIDEEIRSRG